MLWAGGCPAPSLAALQAGKPAQETSPGFVFPGRSLIYHWSHPKEIFAQEYMALDRVVFLDYDDVEPRSCLQEQYPAGMGHWLGASI